MAAVSSLFTFSAFIIHSVFWKKSQVVCLFVSRKLGLIMSLFKYFKCSDPAHPKMLPQPDGPLVTLMPSSSIVAANKEVKTTLDSSVEHDQGTENRQHLFLGVHRLPLPTTYNSNAVWIMSVVHFFVAAKPLADRSFPYVLVNMIPSNFGLNNVEFFVHSHFRDQQYT